MAIIFEKTKGLTDKPTHYCPGCTHGIIHRLVAEVMEEMDLLDEAIGVAPVGCSVLAYDYFNVDMHEAAHGRAPAVATGIKRVHPNNFVFTYQEMVTWLQSVLQKLFMQPTGVRSLQQFS